MKKQKKSMGQICWESRGKVWLIRHVQDAGIPLSRLRQLEKLEDLEEVVRWNRQGEYRPLRSGADLVSGWVFWAKGKTEFREAIEVIYPGIWGNAEAWGIGKLRVDRWEAALARQTERMRKKAMLAADLPERVIRENCKKRCMKSVIWGGERPEEIEGEVPMLCTGPCGMFWSHLEC